MVIFITISLILSNTLFRGPQRLLGDSQGLQKLFRDFKGLTGVFKRLRRLLEPLGGAWVAFRGVRSASGNWAGSG
jgi:hypothetical protein